MHKEIDNLSWSKVQYGILAIDSSGNFRHFCGYMSPPTKDDFDLLFNELNTDPEFGLVGKMGDSVVLIEAPESLMVELREK